MSRKCDNCENDATNQDSIHQPPVVVFCNDCYEWAAIELLDCCVEAYSE